MRKLHSYLILLMFSLQLSACMPHFSAIAGPKKDTLIPTKTAEAARPKIALVMKTLTNPFFVEMEKGARQAERALAVQLIVKTATQETSVEQQIDIVEDLINSHVDAIVLAPADSVRLIPVTMKAKKAGIAVINIDNQLDAQISAQQGLKDVPFIGPDNETGAYLAARELAQLIKKPTHVAILEGIREAKNAEDRKQGALRAFKENEFVQVTAQVTAHWKIDEAYQVTKQIIIQDPTIGAIYCANDMMALGAIQYLDEIGREDVLVAGFDALLEAKQAIRDRKLVATVDQQAAKQGFLGVEYALKALHDQKLPEKTLVEAVVVTSAGLQD
jgi:ribose transport system substrate-binding protein